MKPFFTLLLSCSFCFAFSQTYTSSCTATPQMERLYRNDAYKSVLPRLSEINSPYKDSIEVPAIYRDSIAKVFYAIQNMAYSSLKDTILHIFGYTNFAGNFPNYVLDSLHFHSTLSPAFRNLSVKNVDLYVSTSVPWANDWAAGNFNNTSNPEINQLVNGLQLSIVQGTGFSNRYYFNIKSAAAINTNGLAFKFNTILNSTTACTPAVYIGDGSSVGFTYASDGIQIKYRHACGDCPSGCTYGRSWTFKVLFDNCAVQYLGAENFGFPNPPNFNLYTCTGTIVPVAFGAVTGYLQSGKAALNWKVLTQQNVKEYVVERSDNGQQFYTAGTIASTSALTADYNWKDVALLTGTAFYRIKAVDRDGKYKYSPIVKISGTQKGALFTVYPNPVVNNVFTLQCAAPATGQMRTTLYSADGKKVWAAILNLAPQTVSRTVTLPAFIKPGMYGLLVEGNGASYRQTLVIKTE